MPVLGTGCWMVKEVLPESKRSFPSPLTSLYKLSGLSVLFPRPEPLDDIISVIQWASESRKGCVGRSVHAYSSWCVETNRRFWWKAFHVWWRYWPWVTAFRKQFVPPPGFIKIITWVIPLYHIIKEKAHAKAHSITCGCFTKDEFVCAEAQRCFQCRYFHCINQYRHLGTCLSEYTQTVYSENRVAL